MAQTSHTYLRLSTPFSADADALAVRRAVQDALAPTLGASRAGAYVDVLWAGPREAVVRAGAECVSDNVKQVNNSKRFRDAKVIAAALATTGTLALVKTSSFLPALLSCADDFGGARATESE
jgi:hypothetical protein